MKFVQLYEAETDTLMQCPVSDSTGEAATKSGALVTPLPVSGLPIKSRLRSERHLEWIGPEEWTGTL